VTQVSVSHVTGRKVARVAGWLLPIICLGFLVHRFTTEAGSLPAMAWTVRSVSALFAAGALVVLIEAAHALGWRTLARSFRPSITWRDSFVLCGLSQIAKYLPGNAFHYVQRFVLARDRGLDAIAASAVIAMDAVLILVAGILVGMPALTAPVRSAVAGAFQDPFRRVLLGLGIMVLILVAWHTGRERLARGLRLAGPLLSGRRVAIATLVNVMLFAVAGAIVALVLHGFWPGSSSLRWSDFVSGFALAFVAGFVTPGSPGGIGVREAILVALYEPTLGAGLAVVLFVMVRLAFILGDCLTFGAAFLLRRPLMAYRSA
jgi:hypothetical protein